MSDEYPFKIAAKILRDPKSLTRDEASELIAVTRKFYDLCARQQEVIYNLERQLNVSEQTVRLLQVSDC